MQAHTRLRCKSASCRKAPPPFHPVVSSVHAQTDEQVSVCGSAGRPSAAHVSSNYSCVGVGNDSGSAKLHTQPSGRPQSALIAVHLPAPEDAYLGRYITMVPFELILMTTPQAIDARSTAACMITLLNPRHSSMIHSVRYQDFNILEGARPVRTIPIILTTSGSSASHSAQIISRGRMLKLMTGSKAWDAYCWRN